LFLGSAYPVAYGLKIIDPPAQTSILGPLLLKEEHLSCPPVVCLAASIEPTTIAASSLPSPDIAGVPDLL